MKDPNMGDTLLDTLQSCFVGRENQIKSVDLGNIFGLDCKLIQELIHTLRHEGYPICGDHDGYFYASCDADIEATAKWLLNMGWRIQETACAMLIAANLDRNAPYALADARFSLVCEDEYRHSTVTARRCVWDGTCETCPSSYRCNF